MRYHGRKKDCGFAGATTWVAHVSFRCEVPICSIAEGQQTIVFKPHILKHHIPELPNEDCGFAGAIT